jgi:hypothetical protein
VAGFDVFHRLTRGTNSRTWGDGGGNNSDDSNGTSVLFSSYEILNLRATLDGISNQMAVLQTFHYSGIEMQKNNSTIAGDQYGTDKYRVDNYGTISMTFKYEPKVNLSRDSPIIVVAGFDIYHRLTHGTNSRTWGDGNNSDDMGNTDDLPEGYGETRVLLATSIRISMFGNDSGIEIHAEGMTKAELIQVVYGDINDSKDEQSQRSGETNGSQPPKIDRVLCFESNFSMKMIYQKNQSYIHWSFGHYLSEVVEGYDPGNRSAHNESNISNRVILSCWRDFNDTMRFEIGLNDDNDYETNWCRITTIMAGSGRGNWSLPEVDDEVFVVVGSQFDLGDKPGLHDYYIDFSIDDMVPGKKPNYDLDLVYNYTDNTYYWGKVRSIVKTINNETTNETYMYLAVDTYKNTTDAAGNNLSKLMFTDIIKIKYATINMDASSGGENLKEVISVVVTRRQYD